MTVAAAEENAGELQYIDPVDKESEEASQKHSSESVDIDDMERRDRLCSDIRLLNVDEQSLPATINACNGSNWVLLLSKLQVVGVARALAFHCTVEKSGEHALWLVLDKAYDTLYEAGNHSRIELALCQYFSETVSLHIHPGTVKSETPAMYYERQKRIRMEAARKGILQDENVQNMICQLGARVMQDSIVLLDS